MGLANGMDLSPTQRWRSWRQPGTSRLPPTAAADPRITDNPIYDAATNSIPIGVRPLSFVGAPGWAGTSVLPNFQQVLTGQATPEEAVDQMIADLEAEIG